jgi:autotransporter-associated beta strand protein
LKIAATVMAALAVIRGGGGLGNPAAHAQTTGFKQTTGGPWGYNDTANWVNNTINGIWNTDLTLTAAQTVTFVADTVLGHGWQFLYAGAHNLTLRGDGGDRTVTLGGDVTVDSATNNRTVTIGSTAANQNLNIALGASRTFDVATGDTLTFVNVISGSDLGITKTGSGTLTLSGKNTFTGGVTINAGTVTVGNNSAFGDGKVTARGGTTFAYSGNYNLTNALDLTGPGSITFLRTGQSGALSTSGAVTIAGNPELIYNQGIPNVFSGKVTLNSDVKFSGEFGGSDNRSCWTGGIDIGDADRTITANFTSGYLELAGALQGNSANKLIITGSNPPGTAWLCLGSWSKNTVLSGTGTPRVEVAGGFVYATVQNTFDGGVTLSGGELRLGASSTPTSGAVVSGPVGKGTLILKGGRLTSALSLTLANNVSISGSPTLGAATGSNNLTFSGATKQLSGTSTVTLAGNTTDFSTAPLVATDGATTTFQGPGNLVFSGGFTAQGTSATTFSNSGTLSFTGGITAAAGANARVNFSTPSPYTFANTMTLTGNLTIGGVQTVNFTGTLAGAGTLTKEDANALWLTGTTSGFSGEVAVNAGTLLVNGSGTLGTGAVTVSAGTLDFNGLIRTLGSTLTLGGGANGTTATVNIGAGGTLTLGGNVTYSATNNPLGASITAGTLALGTTARTFTVGDSTAASIDLEITSVVSGTVGLTKAGAGTLLLSGANTYSGTTTVSAGTLLVNGSLSSGGGAVTVASGATLGGSGTINRPININDGAFLAPGTSVGTLTVAGNVQIDGTYLWELVALKDDTNGTPGTAFDQIILASGNVTGTNPVLQLSFAAGIDPDAGNDFWDSPHVWTVLNNTGTGTLDFNFTTGQWSIAGYGTNGVGGKGTFSVEVGSGSGGDMKLNWVPIPEPGTVVLVVSGGLALAVGLMLRRRRSAGG